jgi:orotate phosphoribosyltransferase
VAEPSARDALREALLAHAVRTGSFTLASGRTASWYLDARLVTFRGDCVDVVGRAVADAVAGIAFDAVGGLTLGADPVALATARATGTRAFAVRKEAKGHGAGGRMAGPVQPDDRVLVVDDTVTTGASTLQALDAIVEHGCTVVAVATLVDRGGELGAELERRGIPYRPVLGAPDLGFAFGS